MSGALDCLREGLAFDALERPWLLAPLVALALLAAWRTLRRRPGALGWPAIREAHAAGASARDPRRVAAAGLRAGALSLVAFALAGPVSEHTAPPPPGEGLDIVLVLDTSGSMRALDAHLGAEWRPRVDLAREVVARFARHRAAAGDRVGLVVFGQTAFTLCPLTSDGALLGAALDRVEAGMAGEATALGDALALAVKRVGIADDPASGAAQPSAGRVVVLLSDGRSNAGAIPPDLATALARTRRVRVHTVGIGSEGEVAMARPGSAPGRALRFERHDLDAATLEEIAAATGGRFFEARTSRDLEAVYAAIDHLERVARRSPPRRERRPRPEPFLSLAGVLLAVELVTLRGPTRPIP